MIDILNKIKKIKSFLPIENSDNLSNNKILNLDLYNQIQMHNLFLYMPVDIDGWILGLNFINKLITHNKIKYMTDILINSKYCGIIELIKFQTEQKINFYVGEYFDENMSTKSVDYIRSNFKIQTVNLNLNQPDIKFDIILTDYYFDANLTDITNLLKPSGILVQSYDLFNLSSTDLENKLAKCIFIKQSVINPNGIVFAIEPQQISSEFSFVSDSNTLNSKIHIKHHLKKLYKIYKKKLDLINIQNSNIKNKLINLYETKILLKLISLMTYYDLPIKIKYEKFYDQKILKIKQKTYAVVNFLSYKFITYEDIMLEFDDDLPIKTYDDLHNISMNLNKIKRAIDTRYYKKWQYVTHQLDAYDKLGEYLTSNFKIINSDQKVSNAFSKMYEMLTTYELVPKSADNFKSFHFCEAPGMFIIGINHYIQTKTNILNWEWYGNSLCQTTEKTALIDTHGLIKANSDKWLIGPAKSGDIRDLSNIDFFKFKLSEVDFISSDCGISVNFSDANTYEELIAETDFAQFINVLNLLKIGGSAIIKTFIPLELASNVCLIYTLSKLFKSVYLSKPITSRPANSEVYIILIGYLGIDQNFLNKLKNLLNNFDPTVSWIKNIPDSFIAQLTDYVHDLTKQQMTYLLNIFCHVDLDINFQSDPNIKKKTNEYWVDKFKFQSNVKSKLI